MRGTQKIRVVDETTRLYLRNHCVAYQKIGSKKESEDIKNTYSSRYKKGVLNPLSFFYDENRVMLFARCMGIRFAFDQKLLFFSDEIPR